MGSTNKTPNYNLPQFINTDKPTWLGDMNEAFSSIDTGMKTNSNSADSAITQASQALTTANNAITEANQASSNATTAGETATSANTKATQALNTANQAQETANKVVQLLNLSVFESINVNNISATRNGQNLNILTTWCKLTSATNSEQSLFKLYGKIQLQNISHSNDKAIISFPTTLRPTSDIIINEAVCQCMDTGSPANANITLFRDLKISTNGTATIETYINPENNTSANIRLYILPVLYFLKNFGDSISPQ